MSSEFLHQFEILNLMTTFSKKRYVHVGTLSSFHICPEKYISNNNNKKPKKIGQPATNLVG